MNATTATGPGASVHLVEAPRREGRAERIADTALDVLLVGLALWTVVYHVAIVLRIGSDTALVVTTLLAVVGGWLWLRVGSRSGTADQPLERPGEVATTASTYAVARPARRWTRAAGGFSVLAAVGMAASLPWWIVLVGWLGATAAGLVVAGRVVLALPRPAGPPSPARPRWEVVVVLTWAVGLAVLSTWIRRSNPDDLYYVNLSQWVAAHGTFPLRDTLFADLRWPMTSWPPAASYDALAGAVAHPLGLRGGTVVYEVVPPLMTLAAVLAMWRLLRAWRAPHVAWTLTVALAFLLLDGTSSYASPGNLFVTRLWQGKIILLCVVVPLALVHALRYVERPDRRGLARLGVVGAAAVGCSTTAMFLLPVVAVAGMAPLLRRPRAALAGFAALAAYPLALGVVTLAVGGRSADDFGARRLYRFDPEWIGHAVFLTAAVAFVGVLAVLIGPLVLPHPAARLTTAVMLLAVGLVFVPGVTQAAYRLVGLGPTLWRLTWGLTVGALVGVAAVRAWTLARERWSWPVLAMVAAPAYVVYALTAPPTLARETNTSFDAPLHWQRSDSTRDVVAWMLRTLPRDSVVLGPDGVSVTVSVTTTALKPVAPREYFISTLEGQRGFDSKDRRLLAELSNHDPGDPWVTRPTPEAVRQALDSVDVRAACFETDNTVALKLVRDAGFRDALRTASYRCLVRSGVE